MDKQDEGKEEGNDKSSLLKVLTLSLRIPMVLLLLLLVSVIAGTVMFMAKNPNAFSFIGLTGNPQLAIQQRNEKTLANLGRLMDLPVDEQPTIATVTDVDAVSNQPFFKNAKNDDVVLIYTSIRKAILYRPDEERIIEVGAVNINQQNQAGVPQENQTEPEGENEEEAEEFTPTLTETQTSATEEESMEEVVEF